MKNVLLLVHGDQGQEARLQAALDVTRAVDGHLICLDVVALPRVYAEGIAGSAYSVLVEDERAREDANCAALTDRLSREDVAWDLRQTTGDLIPAIRQAAEMADLIVLNSRFEGYSAQDWQRIAGDAVMDIDRPILALPDDCKGIDLAAPALIAWDGSHEAAESLRAAVPLLRLAEEAVLLEVQQASDKRPASEAAQYLSRHGISCRTLGVAADRPIADAILQVARELGAGYIVMGAFGHSRIREAMFGGVTRSMLADSDLPLLLAH